MSITVTSGGDGLVVVIDELERAGHDLRAWAVRADAAHDAAAAAAVDAQALDHAAAHWLRLAGERLASLAGDARLLVARVTVAADVYAAAERAAAVEQHLTMLTLYATLQALFHPMFAESDATATRVGDSFRASAPTGFAALAARIPASAAAGPQVRVEEYVQDDGERRWVVYAAGTSTWSPFPGADPFDLTSDVSGVETGWSGSAEATVRALTAAGWKPGDEVLPVGHSQGGLVATALAAGGVVTAPMLVTFGSPTRQVKAPKGTLDIAVEHSDDVVPLTGGSLSVPGDQRVKVREPAPPVPKGAGGLATHSMIGYEQTAQAMDESDDARLVAARERLERFTGGKNAEVTLWQGARVIAPSGPPPIGSNPPSGLGAW